VLLLDEPFNGMDPRQRMQLMEVLNLMGEQGRTVLFSSHILEEVEQIAGSIQVMVAGRHAASGGFREIRQLMTERPHQYTIRSDDDRALAAAIIADPSASSVQLVAPHDPEGRGVRGLPSTGTRDGAGALHVQATDFAAFVRALPQLASRHRIRLYEVSPADESLESVFAYLVQR
jgi:ABC-2 type transport system ATP-binding protein